MGKKSDVLHKKKLSPGRIHLGFNQGQWLQISSTILGICFQVQHGRMVKLDRKEEMSVKFRGSLGFAGPVKETAMILQVPTNLRHSNRDFSPQISHDIPNQGMDQYLLIPFLGEWPSIYQLFWCSPGVQAFFIIFPLNFGWFHHVYFNKFVVWTRLENSARGWYLGIHFSTTLGAECLKTFELPSGNIAIENDHL